MANKTDKKIDYSLSFNVDGCSEEITSLQYLYNNKWTDLK